MKRVHFVWFFDVFRGYRNGTLAENGLGARQQNEHMVTKLRRSLTEAFEEPS